MPTAVRYPRGNGLGVDIQSELQVINIGRSRSFKQALMRVAGGSISILAFGSRVQPAFEAAQALATQGLAVRIVNMRYVKPLDEALLDRLGI